MHTQAAIIAKVKFIDLHTHAKGRLDFFSGPGALARLLASYAEAGVEGVLPTVYSAPIERMRADMQALRDSLKDIQPKGRRPRSASKVLGVHLEGPFLNPLRCGALDAASFIPPTISALKALISGFEDMVKVITLAPEMRGALKVIRRCTELGIRVNMGHSDATYSQALAGKEAGATGVTHLFNAMRPFHHREPGLSGLALMDRDLYIEVIADGIHLSAEALQMVFRLKRPERILLVSDSVKGPMRKGGVLQGGGGFLPKSAAVLEALGIGRRALLLSGRINPLRYISM